MAQTDFSTYRVAVIEYDPPIRNLYLTKLELSGFTVRPAANGIEGLELVKEFRPHLILLDLLMPEMTGDEMLQRLRSEEWGADMRVIILTNISRSEAPSVLRFLNVDRYIVKAHYTPTQVIDVVKEVLHIR
jgi:DNA-binding response OmpR family regulator